MTTLERVPPHNLEAEESVLGSMILSAAALSEVVGELEPGDFFRSAHQRIYEAIRDMHSEGNPVDIATTVEELKRRQALEDVGGALFIHHLTEIVGNPASAAYYAKIVADHALLRRLIEEAGQTLSRAYSIPEDPATFAAEAAIRFQELALAQGGEQPLSRLRILDFSEVVTRVESDGPPSWLVEGLWPADAYGVLGAEDKAGKTWALLDMAVSVATGSPWMGRFVCPMPGPVVLFLGEGGERATLRRLDAIVASRGGERADLNGMLRLCFKSPRLGDSSDMREIQEELRRAPRMVGLDPLYLSAPAGKSADLSAMGQALYSIQALCQEAQSALVVVTHWNKTGEGGGANRFTGVGPGAWGRVLGSAAVEQRTTDPDLATNVLLRWSFSGGEIPDSTFRMRRRVQAMDPESLSSPLTYEVEIIDKGTEGEYYGMGPRASRTLAALQAQDRELTVTEIGDALAEDGKGPPLKRRTIQAALAEDLEPTGLVERVSVGRGLSDRWSAQRARVVEPTP